MKKVVASIVTFLLFTASAAQSFNWSYVADKMLESTFQLRTFTDQGYCSGWVTNNKRNYAITAEHCVNSSWALEGGIVVDGFAVEVLEINEKSDWAVLRIPGIDRPELEPQLRKAHVGDEAAAFGFAYGHQQPVLRVGTISALEHDLSVWGLDGLWTVTDQTFIGGMSGGPVVDIEGRVVSMVQRGNGDIGIGRSIQEIYKQTKKYWR